MHSALRVHMEQVDILVGEEAQQDMDLKSAFVPAIPRQPFLRLLFGDPKQSPGGVADNLREHRALLLKAPIGLLAAHRWYMPHDLPAVLCNLLHSSTEVPLDKLTEAADEASRGCLGCQWHTEEHCPAPLRSEQHCKQPTKISEKSTSAHQKASLQALDMPSRGLGIATSSNKPALPRTDLACQVSISGV